MTVDEGMAIVRAKIDAILKQRWERMELQMLVDQQLTSFEAPPVDTSATTDDGSWSRVSIGSLLQQQKDIDRKWRRETLANIRAKLEDPSGWIPIRH